MQKYLSSEDLSIKIKKLKLAGKKIVMCHGVFDILHPGHLLHFQSAKKYGDILIVSVTSDEYVNKGFNRPVLDIKSRIKLLTAMQIIDFVCENNAKDSSDLIKKLKPNFYCKGPDFKNLKRDVTKKIYLEKKAIESVGGKLRITNDQVQSSSKIINSLDLANDDQSNFLKNLRNKINYSVTLKKINDMKKLKVLVIGETIIDEYHFCEALGKSGKEPVLTMKFNKKERYLGGCLAIARHLSSFCKKISVISFLGEDLSEQNFIKKKLESNIETFFLKKKNSPTIIKKRFIEENNNIKTLGVYSLNDENLCKKDENMYAKIIKKKISKCDLVIISDYGHGVVTKKIANLIEKSKKFYAVNAQINSSNVGHHNIAKFNNMDLIIINENELRHELRDHELKAEKLSIVLKNKLKAKSIVVTQGKNGAFMISGKKLYRSPAFAKNIKDKIGAGDSMLSLISISNWIGLSPELVLYLGSLAGAKTIENFSNSDPINKSEILKILFHQLA